MIHEKLFYLTEASLDDLDFSGFHIECHPKGYQSCTAYISSAGQIELYAAGPVWEGLLKAWLSQEPEKISKYFYKPVDSCRFLVFSSQPLRGVLQQQVAN